MRYFSSIRLASPVVITKTLILNIVGESDADKSTSSRTYKTLDCFSRDSSTHNELLIKLNRRFPMDKKANCLN